MMFSQAYKQTFKINIQKMVFNPFSLSGKTILVTGASSGIGRGIAIQCSKMGGVVLITGRNKERLQETFNMLEGTGHQMILADLSSNEELENLVAACPEVNGFVYCAGILKICTLRTITDDILNETLKANVLGTVKLTSLLVKKKKLQKRTSIVLVSSLSGNYIAGTGELAYSTSKGALNGFMRSAALEMASKLIRVNAVCPALVPTDLSRQYHDIVAEEELKAEISHKYPLKRMGTVEDVANACVYLLSDASSWITGTNIIIDGGLTLR